MMNRILILLIMIVLLLPTQSKAQNEQHSMSLKEAVEYALAHNQNILNTQLDVYAAEAFVKEKFCFRIASNKRQFRYS